MMHRVEEMDGEYFAADLSAPFARSLVSSFLDTDSQRNDLMSGSRVFEMKIVEKAVVGVWHRDSLQSRAVYRA